MTIHDTALVAAVPGSKEHRALAAQGYRTHHESKQPGHTILWLQASPMAAVETWISNVAESRMQTWD